MSRTLELGDTQVDELKLVGVCQRYRVRELSFFGSAARGEMRPDSDIDMLVDFLLLLCNPKVRRSTEEREWLDDGPGGRELI
jgi:uncharacterized protein